ncbi:ammonium transporter [Planctomycetales bacterium ZRK34]|nr:ammonium transporter [Planctomycetales bacterium ZRK34]
MENINLLDMLWVLLSAVLVFSMQAGFLCLEAGLTRSKNSINVAIKNVTDFGLSMVLFWAAGYAIMFGVSYAGWFGTTGFLVSLDDPWNVSMFLFQVAFAGTAVTIVSGAVAERVRFGAYLMMTALVAGVIYPVFGHWAWNENGWLHQLGFVDFAGSTVVHSVGGWASLAAVMIIGPRTGRFGADGAVHEVSASNLPLAMLGVLILWFGWIGFNGGSTLAFNEHVPGIIANTVLAAAAGMCVSIAVDYLLKSYPHPSSVINGVLGGLVAITANCHCVAAGSAIIIGAVGAVVALLIGRQLERMRIDDVVAAVPVHMGAGVWGTLAVAIFGESHLIGTGLPFMQQFSVQVLGAAVCFGLTFTVTWITLTLLNRVVRLRVNEQEEFIGLNAAEHHATTELFDFVNTIEYQARTMDLSLRAPVEPFTEVGQIADRYNGLMDKLQQSTTDIEELRTTEKLLREANGRAEAASQAKSEFLANMSHEIRTPLHGILSFAGFGIKRATTKPEKVGEYFTKIDTSARRLLLLVNDLLDVSKLEAGKMVFHYELRDLGTTVAAVVDEFDSLLSEREMRVQYHKPDELMRAEIDHLKIMQVVRNLVNNAIKFSPAGTAIEIDMQRTGESIRIRVRDHGDGIPKDELETIFDKFIQSSTTKSGAGGTGLGLAICAEIVRGHHGRIWAENSDEGGACFNVVIPMKQPREVPAEPSAWRQSSVEQSADTATD